MRVEVELLAKDTFDASWIGEFRDVKWLFIDASHQLKQNIHIILYLLLYFLYFFLFFDFFGGFEKSLMSWRITALLLPRVRATWRILFAP